MEKMEGEEEEEVVIEDVIVEEYRAPRSRLVGAKAGKGDNNKTANKDTATATATQKSHSSTKANNASSRGTATAVACIAVLTCVMYLQTISFNAVYDDSYCVLKNPSVRPRESTLGSMFSKDFWGSSINGNSSNTQWRPLTTFTYRADYVCWCQDAPENMHEDKAFLLSTSPCLAGFRLTNLALSVAANTLVYAAARAVLGLPSGPALFSALLFTVHPVHVESLATLYGRADVLCAVLHLGALVSAVQGWHPLARYTLAFALGLLSITAKESGLATLPMVPLCAALVAAPHSKGKTVSVPHLRAVTSAAVGLVAAVLSARKALITKWTPPITWTDNPYMFIPKTFASRWLTIGHIHARYLLWLFCPLTHAPNYGWNAIPSVESFSDPRNALTVLAYLTVLGPTLLFLRRKWWRELVLVAWGLGLFLPASNVFFYVGTAFADRLLYLPSVPFCLLLGSLAHRLCTDKTHSESFRKAALVAGGVVLVLGLTVTMHRLPTWATAERLWKHTSEKFPNNTVAVSNYALELQKSNRYAEAVPLLERLAETLESDPNDFVRADPLAERSRTTAASLKVSVKLQAELLTQGPEYAYAMAQKAIEDVKAGKEIVGPDTVLRDVVLSGVLKDAPNVEDEVLKAVAYMHTQTYRWRDLYYILTETVRPRRIRSNRSVEYVDSLVKSICPYVDGFV